MSRKPIALTMGDPAGIGPEVTLKALRMPAVAKSVQPILVGDPRVWDVTARRLDIRLHLVSCAGSAPAGSVRVVATSALPQRWCVPGLPRAWAHASACGEAAYQAILAAVGLVQDGRAAAIVTAPISKAHLNAAGHDFPGHTELLAKLGGGVPVRMMMAGPRLRVVLVTIHMALAQVPKRLSREAVLETITITDAALRCQFGIAAPRIAIAGLNPHAGEGGLFGDEEARFIAPAVHVARRRQITVQGPLAADGMFAAAAEGAFDAVICMYHDQGLAPFKLLHFADGVNVTLGLPFVRTSPDHGTAFDIAGRDVADARSMAAAIALAARLAVGS